VNTLTGLGLPAALEDADAVIDVTNAPRTDDGAALEFFAASATALAGYEREAGVAHHVALSIVGADTVTEGYFAAKSDQEHAIRNGGVPYTVLRSTQFFEFARQIADWNTHRDTVRLPSTEVQPVASEDVAESLVRLVMVGTPAGILEIGGPSRMTLPVFVQRVLLSDSDNRYVLEDDNAVPHGFNISGPLLVPKSSAIQADTSLDVWLGRELVTAR
jgi:uncharacterized protein YbjT (DUF2867 family)